MGTATVTPQPLAGTDKEVAKILESYLHSPEARLRFDYGDWLTGQSWSVESEVEGYLRLSPDGNYMLAPMARSTGGVPLRTDCIVSIWSSKGTRLFKHPKYTPKFKWSEARVLKKDSEAYDKTPFRVMAPPWGKTTEESVKSFGTEIQAIRWMNKKQKFEVA